MARWRSHFASRSRSRCGFRARAAGALHSFLISDRETNSGYEGGLGSIHPKR